MGETLGREFSLSPVDTGRSIPGQSSQVNIPNLPGMPEYGNQATTVSTPAVPIQRPSFLNAFLANLGPALAGGLAASPGNPNGTGLAGALAGVQDYKQKEFQRTLQAKAMQTQQMEANTNEIYKQAEISRMNQLTPLEVQQQKLQLQATQGIRDLANSSNSVDQILSPMSQSLGQLTGDEQAQLDSAKASVQANLKQGKFDLSSYNSAVSKISQDRIAKATKDEDVGKRTLNDYLTDPTIDKGVKNKNAATFKVWESKQNAQANAAVQGGMLSDAAKQMASQLYQQTGQLPAGMRSPAMSAGILNSAAQGGQNIAANKASYAADTESLKALQKNVDQVSAFENTANKNLDLFTGLAKKAIDSGIPLMNAPLRSGARLLGGTDQAAMDAARQVAVNEIAKVTSSPGLSGQLSDSARHEVAEFIPATATYGQALRVAQVLQTDMANRHASYAKQISDIKGRLGGKSGGGLKITRDSSGRITGVE